MKSSVLQDTAQVYQERLNERLSKIEDLLSNALEAQESSQFSQSSQPEKDMDHRSRFWTIYEKIAKQDDEDLLERYNGTLDVLLIFAGLFSGVSSSFIANTESNLQPDPTDTTNALLQLLVQAAFNQTTNVPSITPSTPGPDSTIIWTQALAYASLSLSLLAAFLAVLGKQWLGHYKNTRFGYGSQEARCIHRQLKLVAMNDSYFYFILDSLPVLLQLSLVSFGISIAGSIYVQQRVPGGIIIAMLLSGVIFYATTTTIGFLYHNSPYQTALTSDLRNVIVRFFTNLERRSENFTAVLKQKYRQRFQRELYLHEPAGSMSSLDTEEKGLRDFIHQGQIHSDILQLLKHRMSDIELQGYLAVKWVLETSTDPQVIDEAINMVPEVVWPAQIDRTTILYRLREYYVECIKHRCTSPMTVMTKARACDRAIMHLLWTTPGTDKTLSTDAFPMIWRFSDPNYRGYPEYICARLYRDQKFRLKSHPITDPDWVSYIIPYIIRLRRSDDVVIVNSVPIWCSILKSQESSKASKLNSLAGVVRALSLPLTTNIIAFHDKSDAESTMFIGAMYLFRQALQLESIAELNIAPIVWHLVEPFSLALNALSPKVNFDLYPELEGSAYWALRLCFAALSRSSSKTGPVFEMKRLYKGALRIFGHIIRQTAGAVEEFQARFPKFGFNSSYDVEEKLLDIVLEAGEQDLDLAADALLLIGVVGWPIPISSSLLEKSIPTLNACLTHKPYHRSTTLYAIWAGRRHLQPARVAQLGSRVFPSLIHITPSLQNLTDINLSIMISRITVKHGRRELSPSDRNSLFKLANSIPDLPLGFQFSNDERLVNLARLPIQLIDLCMRTEGSRNSPHIRKSLLPTVPFESLNDIGICGWKWFEPHGYGLLSGHDHVFWNGESDISCRVYTQLYFDFPDILSSFILWTSGLLVRTLILPEVSDASYNLFTDDALALIHQTVDKLIDSISNEIGRASNVEQPPETTENHHQIRDLVSVFFDPGELINLCSVRKKDLEKLLTETQSLQKLLVDLPKHPNGRVSRESDRSKFSI